MIAAITITTITGTAKIKTPVSIAMSLKLLAKEHLRFLPLGLRLQTLITLRKLRSVGIGQLVKVSLVNRLLALKHGHDPKKTQLRVATSPLIPLVGPDDSELPWEVLQRSVHDSGS